MRIGICGGTFDPFHRGHLDPILNARGTMQWDRVLYVPAYQQPFKVGRDAASAYDRYAMTVLATEECDFAFVSPVELERGAISYTVDTLQHFRSELPDATLDWVIGDDNLEKLLDWKSIDTIFELANFAVLARTSEGQALLPVQLKPRVTDPNARPRCGAVVFTHNPTVPVSSTEVRRRIRAGEPIDELVDGRVARYIQHYGLYRKGDRERSID